MMEFFTNVLQIATPIFAISSMAAVGLANRPEAIIGPLRNWRLVVTALAAGFLLVPLLAWAVSKLLALDAPFETGLMLVAVAAGAPFVIKFVEIARGNLALATGVLVLLLVATVGYMPIVLPFVLGDVQVDAGAIAQTLTWTMFAPLVAGVALLSWSRARAGRLRSLLGPVSTVALVVLVLSTLLANLRGIVDIFGERAILAALLVIAGAFACGYLLGGRDAETRTVLGFATAQRNIAAAMVVATQNFGDDRDVVVMVVVTSLVGMAILFPTAAFLGARTPTMGQHEAPDGERQDPGQVPGGRSSPGVNSRLFRPVGAARRSSATVRESWNMNGQTVEPVRDGRLSASGMRAAAPAENDLAEATERLDARTLGQEPGSKGSAT